MASTKTIVVRTRKGVQQRSRCSMAFGKEPRKVEVTPDQLAQIEADPRLRIVSDSPGAPAKQKQKK